MRHLTIHSATLQGLTDLPNVPAVACGSGPNWIEALVRDVDGEALIAYMTAHPQAYHYTVQTPTAEAFERAHDHADHVHNADGPDELDRQLVEMLAEDCAAYCRRMGQDRRASETWAALDVLRPALVAV